MSISSTYSAINSFEEFFLKCEEKLSGTFIIATTHNKSCQVTIVDGRVTLASMGKIKGQKVAEELVIQGIKTASFNIGMKFPHSKMSVVSSSNNFLDKMGRDIISTP